MEAVEHLTISTLLGIPVAYFALYPEWDLMMFLFYWAIAIPSGVLIDLDHFLLARINRGSWEDLQNAVRNPADIMIDNQKIMSENALTSSQRYFSHLLIFVTVPYTVRVLGYEMIASVIAVIMMAHILSDVYASVTRE